MKFTLAGAIFLSFAIARMRRIECKYLREDENVLSMEELVTRATLEDIIQIRQNSVDGFLSLCLMTIGSVMH